MNEIAPCPFCGSKPKIFNHRFSMSGIQFYIVICNNPRCMGASTGNKSTKLTKENAIAAWNHRQEVKKTLSREKLMEKIYNELQPGYTMYHAYLVADAIIANQEQLWERKE